MAYHLGGSCLRSVIVECCAHAGSEKIPTTGPAIRCWRTISTRVPSTASMWRGGPSRWSRISQGTCCKAISASPCTSTRRLAIAAGGDPQCVFRQARRADRRFRQVDRRGRFSRARSDHLRSSLRPGHAQGRRVQLRRARTLQGRRRLDHDAQQHDFFDRPRSPGLCRQGGAIPLAAPRARPRS
jgi:hypothetical protein